MNISTLPINVFYAYAKQDEEFRIQLEKHLSLLQRQGIISSWYFRKLTGGDEWRGKIDHQINNSPIILLLISSDFISSDYCYDVEMKRAIELHDSKEARVIPIILRPVYWKSSPFAKLQALPTDGKPITQWPNWDEAFLDIAQGIIQACEDLLGAKISDIQFTSITHNTLSSSERRIKNVYCSRCGAIPGQPSTCVGLELYHDFCSYSGNVYCARCGATPGKKSTCLDVINPYHDFRSYFGNVYCSRCGATPGQPSTCVGLELYHDFCSYSGNVYCARCGATPGKKSTCVGLELYHDFKSYT
jgi:hypothetical protein